LLLSSLSFWLALAIGPTGFYPLLNITKIVLEVRLERVLADLVLAMLLAPSTLALQKLFSNDLVDPYLMGSLAGAFVLISLGALVMGVQALTEYSVFTLGFLGSMFAAILIIIVATKKDIKSALIAGIGLSLALQGLASVLAYLVSAKLNRPFLPLLMGTTSFVTWNVLAWSYAMAFIELVMLLILSWKISAIEYGEEISISLKIDSKKVEIAVLAISSMASGMAVGCCGIIPFVGLIAANIAKRLTPLRPVIEMINSVAIAFIIVSMADTLATSMITEYGSLPVGAFLSLIGGLVLAILMLKETI